MPKRAAASTLLVAATKCSSIRVPPCARNQARAVAALVIVSCVVKVLLATTKSVSAGRCRRSTEARSAPSTLATKWKVSPGWAKPARARTAICGPRSLPPMPMLTTWRKRTARPRAGARADRLGEGEHRVEDRMDVVAERRPAARRAQAVWSTARRSLVLIGRRRASRRAAPRRRIRAPGRRGSAASPRRRGSSTGRRRPRARRTTSIQTGADRARTPRAGRSRGRAPRSGRRARPRRRCGRSASRPRRRLGLHLREPEARRAGLPPHFGTGSRGQRAGPLPRAKPVSVLTAEPGRGDQLAASSSTGRAGKRGGRKPERAHEH